MAKYIKCDCCNNKIELGDSVYKFSGYAGLYCSSDCFFDAYGEVHELDEDLAEDCYHKIYDDVQDVERQIIVDEMNKRTEEYKAEMQRLQQELEALTAQN
jgi:hypothetical protein